MSDNFFVICVNKSQHNVTFVLYQEPEGDGESLSWLSATVPVSDDSFPPGKTLSWNQNLGVILAEEQSGTIPCYQMFQYLGAKQGQEWTVISKVLFVLNTILTIERMGPKNFRIRPLKAQEMVL